MHFIANLQKQSLLMEHDQLKPNQKSSNSSNKTTTTIITEICCFSFEVCYHNCINKLNKQQLQVTETKAARKPNQTKHLFTFHFT